MSFASMMQNKMLVGYGDVVVAAGGVAGKIGMLIAMVVMGICMGIQPAIAYSHGAGDRKRMSEIIKSTGILAVLTGTILTVVCFNIHLILIQLSFTKYLEIIIFKKSE